jgi:hypothetical protein
MADVTFNHFLQTVRVKLWRTVSRSWQITFRQKKVHLCRIYYIAKITRVIKVAEINNHVIFRETAKNLNMTAKIWCGGKVEIIYFWKLQFFNCIYFSSIQFFPHFCFHSFMFPKKVFTVGVLTRCLQIKFRFSIFFGPIST